MNSSLKHPFWIAIGLSYALCLMTNCSPLQQKRRIPECKLLFGQIEQGWYRDTFKGLYRFEPRSMGGSEEAIKNSQECFKGLGRQDIERLFGKPDHTYGGHMTYFMSEACLEKEGPNTDGCHMLSCEFGNEDVVRRIKFVTTSEIMDWMDIWPPPSKRE